MWWTKYFPEYRGVYVLRHLGRFVCSGRSALILDVKTFHCTLGRTGKRLHLFDCNIDLGNIDEFGTFVLRETLKFWKYYFKSVLGDCGGFKTCPG